MNKTSYAFTCIILILLLALPAVFTGCSDDSGGGNGGGTEGSAVVSGYVTQSYSGPALNGSSITIHGGSGSAVTDSGGFFSMNTDSGTYDILAAQQGYAASKLQGVEIQPGDNSNLHLIQKPIANNSWAVEAPTITVTGIVPHETVSGNVRISVSVTAANPVYRIMARLGNRTSYVDLANSDSNILSFTWNSSEYPVPPEGSFLNFVAYDINFNRTEYSVPVNSQGAAIPPVYGPSEVLGFVITVAQDAGMLAKQREQAFKGTDRNPYIMQLAPGKTMDLRSVPADTNIYGAIYWDEVLGAQGYSIYKKQSHESEYRLIGHKAGNESNNLFYDTDPSFTIGATYQYAVSAYTTAGSGPMSVSPPVTVLDRFEVNLISPAHNETNVSLNPVFSWSPTPNVGVVQYYEMLVIGLNDSSEAFYGDFWNQTSASPVTLEPNKSYEWNLIDCITGDSYDPEWDAYLAQSVPNDISSSSNGGFVFTTRP